MKEEYVRVSPCVHAYASDKHYIWDAWTIASHKKQQQSNIQADIDFTPLCSSILGELDGP